MADSDNAFTRFAGHVLFPRTTADLTSTAHCPACFTVLSSAVCSHCGLDLNNPAAIELAQVSSTIASQLDRRLNLIGHIRFDSAQARTAKPAAAQVVAEPVPTVAEPIAAAPVFAPPAPIVAQPLITPPVVGPPIVTSPGATAPTAAAAAPRTKRRSSIQVLLLLAGVSLLSLAAVLFVVFAFINYGLVVRSIIIGCVTIAAFGLASWLRRKDYTGTAEGIASFAVVLVFIDAYAVRANDLFGAASPTDSLYWGSTILLAAIGFIVWRQLSGLRVAGIAGFAAVGLGAAMLTYGLTADLDPASRVLFAALIASATGLVHPFAARRASPNVEPSTGAPERILAQSVSVAALLVVLVTAFLTPDALGGTLALIASVVIAAAYCVVAARFSLRSVTVFAYLFAAVGGAAAASSFHAALPHDPGVAYTVIVPLTVATAVFLALDVLTRLTRARTLDGAARLLRIASVAASIVAGMAALAVVALALFETTQAAGRSLVAPWSLELTSALTKPSDAHVNAIIALAIVVALGVAASALSGLLRRRLVLLVASAAVVAIVAVPLLVSVGAITVGWLVLAALGVAAIVLRRGSPVFRSTLALAAATALALGYSTSWLSESTWLAATLAAIAMLIVARWAVPYTVARASLLVLAASLAIAGAAALAQQLSTVPSLVADTDSLRFIAVLAVAFVVLSAIPGVLRLTPTDRRALFWTAAPVAGIAVFALWSIADLAQTLSVQGLVSAPALSLAVSAGLLVGLLLWVVLRGNAPLLAERITASIALAPTVFWVLDAFARTVLLPEFASDLAPITAALLVAAGALALTILRPSGIPRWARETGIVLVAVPAVVTSVLLDSEMTWLVLVLAAVTTLLLSISADGLFASASPRRFVGWLALALGVAGLWWRLTSDNTEAIEPFVLPVAGALLIVALLVWRAQRLSVAAPFIALAGLIVAIVPVGLSGATGPVERALVVGLASAALLIVGSFVRVADPLRRYLDVAAAAGAVGVLVVAVGRTRFIAEAPGTPDGTFDAWIGAAFVVLAAAAVGQLLPRVADALATRGRIGQGLAIVALVLLSALEESVIDDSDAGQLRVLFTLLLAAVVHVAAMTVNRGVLRRPLGITALVLVAFMAVQSVWSGALTPLEISGLVVLVALASNVVALVVPSTSPRWTRDAGLATIAGIAILALLVVRNLEDATWLILAIAGVAALIIAISRDGLFGSTSPRRHLGWLALGLATSGLWWRLAGSSVENVEAYVLPLSGALLAVALLVWRSNRANPERGAAPVIALGGLLVAILPLSLNAATGELPRAIVVFAASAVLLLVGSVVVGSERLRPYLDAAALSGFIGVLVVAIGRSWTLAVPPGTADARLDAWLGATFAVLLVAALGQGRDRVGDNPRLRSISSQSLGLVALSVVFLFEVSNLSAGEVGQVRALSTVLLFAALHVTAVLVDRSPLTRALAWVALGFAAAVAVAGMVVGALDPIEYGTVPVAVALLAGGAIRMSRNPAARSWPHLGPGLLVLFVPPLVATFDDRPIWRAAAIAVVAIAAIILGLTRKLQAPFIVGAVITIVHVFATFSPQLRQLYSTHSWVVWIVIGTLGGTLLVVFAARFEKSLHSARETFAKVSQLR